MQPGRWIGPCLALAPFLSTSALAAGHLWENAAVSHGDLILVSDAPPNDGEDEVPGTDWDIDVWHFVGPNSPFHSIQGPTRHGAAVVQSDGAFAHFVLGTPSQGALVTVSLPGNVPSPTLRSDLVMPAGNVLSREISADQLIAQPGKDGGTTNYSFRIAPGDIELFMAASHWHLKTGQNTRTLTLKGSRNAISRALSERDTPSPDMPTKSE